MRLPQKVDQNARNGALWWMVKGSSYTLETLLSDRHLYDQGDVLVARGLLPKFYGRRAVFVVDGYAPQEEVIEGYKFRLGSYKGRVVSDGGQGERKEKPEVFGKPLVEQGFMKVRNMEEALEHYQQYPQFLTTKRIEDVVENLYSSERAHITPSIAVTLQEEKRHVFLVTLAGLEEKIGEVGFFRDDSGHYALSRNLVVDEQDSNDGKHVNLEVSRHLRGLGFGNALLSLAIGVARRDYCSHPERKGFVMKVEHAGDPMPIFSSYGFDYQEGFGSKPVNTAFYSGKPREIEIKARQDSPVFSTNPF